jgi:hypothetical protein
MVVIGVCDWYRYKSTIIELPIREVTSYVPEAMLIMGSIPDEFVET